MSLEDLGYIGRFVAAVAVVVSLIYLADQIRAHTKQVRSAEHHRFRDETGRLHEIALSSREHAELLTRMASNEALSPLERTCAYAFADRMTNHWLAPQTAYRLGTIPKDYYENLCIEVRNVTSRLPITRQYIRSILGIHPTARDLPLSRLIFDTSDRDDVETPD